MGAPASAPKALRPQGAAAVQQKAASGVMDGPKASSAQSAAGNGPGRGGVGLGGASSAQSAAGNISEVFPPEPPFEALLGAWSD